MNAKQEIIERLTQCRTEAAGKIHSLDWYCTNDERDIDNIKAINSAGLNDSIIVTVEGNNIRREHDTDPDLDAVVSELVAQMAPYRVEDMEDCRTHSPLHTRKFTVRLKYPDRVPAQ